jgi:HSP20 family protein
MDGREVASRFRALPRSVTGIADWSPSADTFDHGDRLVVKIDLPAMRRDEIDLRLDGGDLVLCGERREKQEVKEGDDYRMEPATGELFRRIRLPFDVEAKDVQATFNEGVLEVEVPKPAETKPAGERIKIR